MRLTTFGALRCLFIRSLIGGLLVCTRDKVAWADDDSSPGASWARRPLAIDAQLGAGTPYGVAGLSLEVSPLRYVTLASGAGWGANGLQIALSTRGRYPFNATTAVAFGLGGSTGAYKESYPSIGDKEWVKTWDRAYWLSSEIALEYQRMGGARIRIYLGIEKLLNSGSSACSSNDNMIAQCVSSSNGELLPYLGIALGRALPIVFGGG
jgi:hypothetical protein